MSGRRHAGWVLAPVVVALLLSGCGGAPDLTADRAHDLQDQVLAVTTAAAAQDWDAADAGIATTRTELDSALDAGDVSTARYHQIDQALDQVASGVAAGRAQTVQLAADQAAAEQAAAAQAAADEAAALAQQTTDSGSGAPAPSNPGHGKKDAPKPKKGK